MEELVVTRVWMAGVVGVMAAFALIALVGRFRRNRSGNADRVVGQDKQ